MQLIPSLVLTSISQEVRILGDEREHSDTGRERSLEHGTVAQDATLRTIARLLVSFKQVIK